MRDEVVRDFIHDLMNQLAMAQGWSKRISPECLDEKQTEALKKLQSNINQSISIARDFRGKIADQS